MPQVGPYTLVSLLGKGGFGEVWRARDEALGRDVALKLLTGDDPEYIKRFVREAQMAAALDHPNIARIFDVGAADGRHFIAMQLVEGAPPKGPLPPRRAAALVRDAARAVHFAHEHGVIHRDLKPANILVSGDRVFVLDFGLARQTRAASSLTASGMLIGTPAYMAPEQARAGRVTPANDVYSLGATLYELLSGRAPFAADSLMTLLAKIADEDAPAWPGDAGAVAARCLDKDPTLRYPSAAALADDLDRVAAGEPIRARPPSLARRGVKFAGRHRTVLAASLLAIVGVALGLALLLPRLARSRAGAQRVEVLALVSAIHEARPYFYVRGEALFEKLDVVRRALAALDARPEKDVEVWAALGMGWYFVGDDARAERALTEASRLAPRDGRVAYYLGRVYMERAMRARFGVRRSTPPGEAERNMARALACFAAADAGWEGGTALDRHAVAVYRAVSEERREDAQRLAQEGLDRYGGDLGGEDFWIIAGYLDEGDRKIECFTRALERRAHYAWALQLRGVRREQIGDRTGALADFTAAIRLKPGVAEAWMTRALLRDDAGDTAGARADFDEALRREPAFVEALVNRAAFLQRAGDLERARADADEAVRLEPHWDHAYFTRAMVRHHAGDVAGSESDFADALRLNPRNTACWYQRGAYRLDRNEFAAAESDLDRAIALGDGADAYNNRALARRSQGDFTRALADAREAVRLEPESPRYRITNAQLLIDAGDNAGAVAACDEAIRRDPSYAEAWMNRGLARIGLRDPVRAAKDLEEAVRRRDTYFEAWSNLGLARKMAQDYDGAIAAFDRAVTLNPNSTAPLLNRGDARMRKGDMSGALADADAALAADPRAALAWTLRGVVRLQLKEHDAAAAAFTEALRIDPRQPDMHRLRGVALERGGRVREAVDEYARALEIAPAGWSGRALVESLLAEARARLK